MVANIMELVKSGEVMGMVGILCTLPLIAKTVARMTTIMIRNMIRAKSIFFLHPFLAC